jgi:type IV secretory pathway VirB4 component
MVIGKSGSGKSHFTKKMFLKMVLEGVKTFIVDPEGEYDIFTQRLGGQIIDVGSGNNSRINPFHIFGVMQEESGDVVLSQEQIRDGYRSIFSSHIQFLEQFMQNLIPDMTNREVARLSKIFNEAYELKKISKYEDFSKYKPEDYPIMDDAMDLIKKRIKTLSDIIVKDSNRAVEVSSELNDLRNLEVYMDRLCGDGSLSTLWNGPTTIDTKNSDLILFDFRKMTNSKNDQVMNAQMMLVLRFLENEVSKNREHNLAKGDNRHVAIVVDEAHVFIDERSPAALYFMHSMIKRIRKYNGIFVVITQNVNDFVGSANIKKYTTSIINGCQYSFIFGLNPADLQALIDLYASVGGFSDQEKEFIANAGIGQCLFVVAPGQRITMYKILVTPKEEQAFKKDTDDQNFKSNRNG